MSASGFVSVALPIPVRRLFTYRIPRRLLPGPGAGSRVVVPLGKRKVVGTVVEASADPPPGDIQVRDLHSVQEGGPQLTGEILELTRFVSGYYLCSWGEAIEAALPPPAREPARVEAAARVEGACAGMLPARATARRRVFGSLPEDGRPVPLSAFAPADRRTLRRLAGLGLVRIEPVPEAGSAGAGPDRQPAPLVPTPGQEAVLQELLPALSGEGWKPFLLFGATGSGKTEVYLRAAEKTLESGRGVLYLVPEIGLTPLLLRRLRGRFGSRVEVLHSGLSRGERYRAWNRVRSGDCRFVVGTRSAVFAPVTDLGLIVVDEEHDTSYKQQETPRYNGRDLAVLRARESGAVLILGSATPSLESFRHACAGRYRLLRLGGRVGGRPLARVRVVDMREEYRKEKEVRPITGELAGAIALRLDRGEQVLVLRNRRGYAVSVFCPSCGNRVECRRCSLTMTWHRLADRLRCHGCNLEQPTPEHCPRCGETDLQFLGEGTEKIEDRMRALFPGAAIERMDRDAVRRKGAHEKLLRRFDAGEIDLMVGTQMIAKGHDFPAVTLVGILSADQSLGLPDFRAGERVFQLLTQVAGRAGRGEKPGEVILQAFDPEHPVLREAMDQDYESFYRRESEYRRALRYPPFTAMVHLLVLDRNPGKAAIWADRVAEAIRAEGGGRLIVTGPGPAPVERLKDRYRQQILVRSAGRRKMVQAVGRALERVAGTVPHRALVVDVDPYAMM